MDRHRDRIPPFPRRAQGPEQDASPTVQELDLSVGSLVFRPSQHDPCAGAGLEQLQPLLRRGDILQSLH